MKSLHMKLGWILTLGLGLTSTQAALVYTFQDGLADGGVIPDGDPSGWQDSRTISLGSSLPIESVTVRLDIAGGWNGDLYGYLRHDTAGGTGFTVLLDHVGAAAPGDLGYGNPGFGSDASSDPFRLSDAGTHSIHTYQDASPSYNASGQLTGTWNAEGSFASFHGLDPNGTWTLYLADTSGGNVSTVQSWGMEVTVPEPPAGVAVAGLGLAAFATVRRWLKK